MVRDLEALGVTTQQAKYIIHNKMKDIDSLFDRHIDLDSIKKIV
jgi:hypothetical protein